jgi:hypothetical protein
MLSRHGLREEDRTMAEAYCVKDKKKVEVQNAEQVTMKNGKPALKGTCPVCGGKVYRIGG